MTEASEPIPEDVMQRAREAFETLRGFACVDGEDGYECVAWEADDAVAGIARALIEERRAERERANAHWLQWHQKRMEISRGFWLRASKKALDGDPRELRNRVDLAEAEPAQLVLSEGQP